MMMLGGNTKFYDFLSEYGLLEEDFKTKYESQAVQWYRQNVIF